MELNGFSEGRSDPPLAVVGQSTKEIEMSSHTINVGDYNGTSGRIEVNSMADELVEIWATEESNGETRQTIDLVLSRDEALSLMRAITEALIDSAYETSDEDEAEIAEAS
jgi:hypothetical protein